MKTFTLILLGLIFFLCNSFASVLAESTAADLYRESYMAAMRRGMAGASAADLRAEEYRMRNEHCDEHHNCWIPGRKNTRKIEERERKDELLRTLTAVPAPLWA